MNLIVNKNMKVAKLTKDYPISKSIFKKFGFALLVNPILRSTIGKIITIEKACQLKKVNLEEFLHSLNNALLSSEKRKENTKCEALSASPAMEEAIEVNNILKTNIYVVVEQYP